MNKPKDSKNLMIGLDIGTSKIVAMAAEIRPEGGFDVVARIDRFAAAWPQLAQGAPRYADLRYPNGFALKRPAEAPAPKSAAKTKKA